MNLHRIVAPGHFVAQYHMNKNGLVDVMEATLALFPSSSMIGYDLARCGTDHFGETFGTLMRLLTLNTELQRKQTKRFHNSLFDAMLDDVTFVGFSHCA